MGLDGIDYQLTTTFKDSDSTSSTHQLAILREWMNEAKINTTFPFGRFGIRMDNLPAFNITPSSTYGLALQGFRVLHDPNRGGKVAGTIITLRFAGDPTGIGG